MSSAASSLRSSTRPSPASIRELAISKAAWESPSAEMMAACFCCSALKDKRRFGELLPPYPNRDNICNTWMICVKNTFSTTKRALSASCWATCFISTASVNSLPKVKCVCKNTIQLSLQVAIQLKRQSGHCYKICQQLHTSETSSRMRPKVEALSVRSSLTCRETSSLWVMSSPASNRACGKRHKQVCSSAHL